MFFCFLQQNNLPTWNHKAFIIYFNQSSLLFISFVYEFTFKIHIYSNSRTP